MIKMEPKFSVEELRVVVAGLAREIERDYAGARPLVIVGVLMGSFVFLSDLLREMVRELEMEVEVDFVSASSYGLRDLPDEEVVLSRDMTLDVIGKDVLLVEDIVDRGLTARKLMRHIGEKGPASLKMCSLFLRKGCEVKPDYVGTEVGPGFLVGYGLDYKEKYRNLPAVYVIEPATGE